MQADYNAHNHIYKKAKAKGWQGWGGNDRLKKGQDLINRLFSNDKIPYKGNALELGCGEGNISRLLHERGFKVKGIEVSKIAVDWAKEKASALDYDIEFVQADLTQRGILGKKKYDLIVDGNCFHCIIGSDRKNFLMNTYDALNINGVLFISSMCSKGDEDETILLDKKPYRHIPTVKNLLNDLKDVGFVIIEEAIHLREKYNHINVYVTR